MAKTPRLRTDEVVTRMLRAAAAAVRDTLPAALRDEPDAVHQHRTRVRRLRAVLAAVRGHVDADAARALRDEYRDWGRALGDVRDLEVHADRTEAALVSSGIDDPHVWRRLVGSDREHRDTELVRLQQLAASAAARQRATELAAFVELPSAHGGGARKDLRRILKHEIRRVTRAHERDDGSLASQHDLRKAGRRLRYVAEAVADCAPGLLETDALVAAGRSLHDALGEQRDALLFADRLRHERAEAAAAGEATAPYDLLLAAATKQASRHGAELKPALRLLHRGATQLG